MARVVLPIAGAIIGAFTPIGPYWGYVAGSVLAGLVGSQTRKSVRAQETGAQTTTEGAPRAIVYGASIVTGNLIDTGPIRIVETTEEAKGSGGPSSTTKTYFRTYAIRVCEGPIAAYLMVKRDGKVVFDVREGSTLEADGTNDIFRGLTARYLGDESQLPDPDLEAIHGAGDVPAYRGSAYVVFSDDDLTARQGSVPQWEFLVATAVAANDIELTPSNAVTVGGLFGGGTFGDEGNTHQTFFDASISGADDSTAFLAYWQFTESTGDYFVAVRVSVGNVLIHTENLTIPNGGSAVARVQLNHANDHEQIDIGWAGAYSGQYAINIQGLTGDAHPIQTPAPGETILVLPADNDFGVVIDAGDYYAARHTTLATQRWRDDLTYDLETLTPQAVILGDIVEDIHDRCGASVPDVSELTDEVAGLVFGSADYNGADAIETLRAPYFFDRAEYDGAVHYPKRGSNSVATITFDDLVEVPDESQREAHPDYPRKLHLGYQASQVNYEMAQATSDRYSPDTRVSGEQALQVPVVLDEEQAANLVARMHKVAWADAEGEIRFSLPIEWIGLTPSECITLDLRDRVRRLRIDRINDAHGVRSLTCRIDRQTAYSSEAPSFIPLPIPPAPPSTNPGDTVLVVLDISALRDVDDILLNYAAVSAASLAWSGAQVQRSLDDGASFTAVQTITTAAVIGTLMADVPEASEHYTDTTNTVRVELLREGHELSSISDLAFVQRGGAFALEKADGSWEVMQYRDATFDSDGFYILSTLHRGLLNSGPSEHLTGATFVLLAGVRAEAAESSWIGTDLVHRAPSIGQASEDAAEQTAEYVGRSQIEWPVTSLVLDRDSDDNIIASWAPRHRLGTDVAPVASVNFEGYRVTLDDGVDTVTFDTTSASFTYDASALSAPVDVTVQALNRFTGPGPETTDSV
jgi:hypothetical protein